MISVPITDENIEMELYDGSGGGNTSTDGNFGSTYSNGPGSVKKLKEILRRQKHDSEDEDSPDVDFNYEDEDSLSSELAELYSYTEANDFQLCQKDFEDFTNKYNFPKTWKCMGEEGKQDTAIQLMLDQLEVASNTDRLTAARSLLYIGQGCWLECQSDAECLQNIQDNVILLYKNGVFIAFVELLNLEIENSTAATNALRKLAVSLADSIELRVILSLLYTMTLVLRTHENTEMRENFIAELNLPMVDDDYLAIRLLTMVTRFCSGSAPHFPMKKCLLLLWKVLLASLGGMEDLRKLKTEYRNNANLPDVLEDTLTISRTMRAASPPASATDILETTNNRRNNRPGFKRSMMAKQSSLDESDVQGLELDGDYGSNSDRGFDFDNSNNGDDSGTAENPFAEHENGEENQNDFNLNGEGVTNNTQNGTDADIDSSDKASAQDGSEENMGFDRDSPRPDTPLLQKEQVPRCLPWTPKVRLKELDSFLDNTRTKFVGFSLSEDRTTLAGLPQPIHEGVRILRSHMYKSLAEVQIETEEDIARNPMSRPESTVRQSPAEILYQNMLPSLPQYMIALLKILLAAAPTSKAKTDSINIMTDVLPEEMPMTVVQSMKLGIDVNRHKEIIVKSVSAILLLLLKHFKINHVYQFEFMSQHLVFANCIPLVLKFFNQNIMAYIGSKNNIALLDFPSCVIGEQPPAELTSESLDVPGSSPDSLNGSGSGACLIPQACWRNMFSCINLLRVLNKLTKWKHSRIMMLVVFKSAPILKRTLKVKHAMLQLYVLKLLKMQTKYLGRQWRKSNMKTMSAIYTKVRHRLNDDWAFGNDVDSRPWDFQAEECSLRCAVDRFNHRRYEKTSQSAAAATARAAAAAGGSGLDAGSHNRDMIEPDDFEPVDNCISSVLGREIELTDEFKSNYEKWLEHEVFGTTIQWEHLLGDVGHIEKEENIDVREDVSNAEPNIEDPHHILKHISQIQPVTTI